MIKRLIHNLIPKWHVKLWLFFIILALLRWNSFKSNVFSNLANEIILESVTNFVSPETVAEFSSPSTKLLYPLTNEFFQIKQIGKPLPVTDTVRLNAGSLLLESASDSCGSCPARLRNLATIALLSEHDNQSIFFLQQYLEFSPDDLMVWKQLGDIYTEKGDWVTSVNAYQRSLIFDITLEKLITIGYRESARYYIDLGEDLANISILAAQTSLRNGQLDQTNRFTEPAILLANQIESPIISANLHFLQGETAYQSGKTESSLQSLRRVLMYIPNANEYSLFRESYAAVINDSVSSTETITPENQIHLIEQSVGDFFLVGFSVNNAELVAGLPLSIRLFWSTTTEKRPLDCEVLTTNKTICVQDIQTTNLIPNAGFEWQPICTNCPINSLGYAYQKYTAPPSAIAVQNIKREGITSQALALGNIPPYNKSGLISYPIRVDPNTIYLQAGWVRSEAQGSAWLGRNWNPKTPNEQHEYVVANYQNDQWKYYATLVFPPEDASTVEIWLLNFETFGTGYFDDLLFIPISQNDKLGDS